MDNRQYPLRAMISFFAFYVLVYGGLNLLLAVKARSALGLGLYGAAAVGFLCTLMVAAPMLVHVLEGRGHEGAATFAAYVGYSWMGFVLLFATGALVVDLCALATWFSRGWVAAIPPRAGFIVIVALAVLINIYGFFEAWNIRPKHLELHSSKIAAPRVRVVQVSDVHLGLMIGPKKLAKIASIVREADPDILVSTGDLVDGTTDDIAAMAGALRDIRGRYGKFAITGNHEVYAGMDKSIAFANAGGFHVLRDELADIPELGVSVTGLDYRRAGWDAMPQAQRPLDEPSIIAKANADSFRLVLKHIPRIEDAALGAFDLQLSGHTHAGQIFPFYIPVRMVFKQIAGLYDMGRGTMLYVSRGTGTWGPAIRFLSPPEVTVIDIVKQ